MQLAKSLFDSYSNKYIYTLMQIFLNLLNRKISIDNDPEAHYKWKVIQYTFITLLKKNFLACI